MKKIKFNAIGKYAFKIQDKPVSAKDKLPEWFKKSPMFYPEKNLKIGNGALTNQTFRKCVPMLDAFSIGYVVELEADINVEEMNEKEFNLTWKMDNDLFELHGNTTHLMETPSGYYEQVIKYNWLVVPETPKGYSLLVIPALAYPDNVFQAVPAVIDSDEYLFNFSLPVWLKKGFTGIVEKGTPIAQIIPFKRDNWESSYNMIDDYEYKLHQQKSHNTTIVNNYFKYFWKRKKFK